MMYCRPVQTEETTRAHEWYVWFTSSQHVRTFIPAWDGYSFLLKVESARDREIRELIELADAQMDAILNG